MQTKSRACGLSLLILRAHYTRSSDSSKVWIQHSSQLTSASPSKALIGLQVKGKETQMFSLNFLKLYTGDWWMKRLKQQKINWIIRATDLFIYLYLNQTSILRENIYMRFYQ